MDQTPPPDEPTQDEPPKDKPRRKSWKRRLVRIAVGFVIAVVIVIGPWPAQEGEPDGQWAQTTRQRLERMPLTTTTGPAQAGAAAVKITPPAGEPLAGFSARDPKTSDGLADHVWAKALSISNGRQTVTIVGADILLVLPDLRDAILQRAGIERENVYFTATHTHSGPGGYAPQWIEQITLGEFDQAILDRLADAFADAITRSRADMKPARIVVASAVPSPPIVANRIDATAEGNTSLACLSIVGADGKHVAGLVTFNAHPTCYGRRNRLISGDYPGMVQRELAGRFGGVWLFAAGAVGSMKGVTNEPRGAKRLADIATKVLSAASPMAQRALEGSKPPAGPDGPDRDQPTGGDAGTSYQGPARSDATLLSGVLEVDLPQIQYRISRQWRLSPIISSLIHERQSYIHFLRINEMLLLGMPADYSGELSARLEGREPGAGETAREDIIPVITSFNGDYIGYLIPHERYALDHYESRDSNFFGPWCGEYFHDLSVELVKRLTESARRDDG